MTAGKSGPPQRRGGVPDSVLIGGLALLLGGTSLLWLATGLAGLLQHGSWPAVRFTHTPVAARRLLQHPDDLSAAWADPTPVPDAPDAGPFLWVLGALLALLLLLVVGGLLLWNRLRTARLATTGSGAPAQGEPARGEPSKARGNATPDALSVDTPSTEPPPTGSPPVGTPSANTPAVGETPADAMSADAVSPPHAEHPETQLPTEITPPRPSSTTVSSSSADPAGTLVTRHLSERALRDRAPVIRPTLPTSGPATLHPTNNLLAFGTELGVLPATTQPLYGSLDQTFLLIAGPHAEEQHLIQQALTNAPGPALITCSDPETYRATVAAREKIGPVLVHDPQQRTDAPNRLRWAPQQDCADPATATTRARALLAPLRPPGRPALADNAAASRLSATTAVDNAQTLLSCWLHAAALDERPFRHVHRWASQVGQSAGSSQREPLRILRTSSNAAPGWSGQLETILARASDAREAALNLVRRALRATDELHVLRSCLPTPSEKLDMEWLLNERGTLYVVGTPMEDVRSEPGVLPLSTALVESVVEHGRRIAVRSSSGRLDPPLLLLLDEVATLAPIPALPELMATGGAVGLPTLAVLRSPEQARHRWADAGAGMHRSAGLRLAMGEVAAPTLSTILDLSAARAEDLAAELGQAPPGSRLLHHVSGPPILAAPTPR